MSTEIQEPPMSCHLFIEAEDLLQKIDNLTDAGVSDPRIQEILSRDFKTIRNLITKARYANADIRQWGKALEAKCEQIQTGSVFEVVDCTEGDVYYPVGHWRTLKEAIASLDKHNDSPDGLCSESMHEDRCHIEIREHAIGGKSGYGKKVYERKWRLAYQEATDLYVWELDSMDGQTMPICPDCKSDKRVALSPSESSWRGKFFCPCNDPGAKPSKSGHFDA